MRAEVIRTTGEREWHELGKDWLGDIRRLIGARTLDMVTLRDRVHVMCVDDDGYETELIDHGLQPDRHRPGQAIQTWENKCIKAKKPVNVEATKLYHQKLGRVVDHQIVGDVAIVDDRDVG